MKSSVQQLKARGFINDNDVAVHVTDTKAELLQLLSSSDPSERSVATRLLPLSPTTTYELLQRLKREKALYTRLEICQKLASGSIETARLLVNELGHVGTNQHRKPTKKPVQKKSYPLPRDLIARTLGTMDPAILPVLLESLNTCENACLSELIDAIGALVFTNPALANDVAYARLKVLWQQYEDHALIQWKLIICFSAFPQSEPFLEALMENQHPCKEELACSLWRLRTRAKK
ncbi:hypothetical protein NRIC_29170 [Enterococcus florum]|uniref:Uncharacterized protein n=1 Tax=Enterococcus florum TaxID=2480627 RepID=A0A4P5PBD4_9ENTE|nr:hypothetical protein [Enterococcus florum]GCF95026.1 hypothetical protein NRIC_29170 [Enterococcus florum]